MSQPPALPGFGHGLKVIFRMQMRRLIRGRKLRLGLVSCALILFAVIAARYASARDVGPERSLEIAQDAITSGFSWGFFKLLAFLLPFLFTSSAIAEEVEGRTFTYVASRPVSRFAMVLGKWAAGTLLAVGLLVGSGLLLHLIGYATEPTALVDQFAETGRTLLALALLGVCYGGICVFWGAVAPDAGGILAGLYLGVIEWLVQFLPGSFRLISMNYLGQQVAGMERAGLMPETAPEIDAIIGGPGILGVGLLFLFFAGLVVQGSEYRFSKA